MQTKRYHIIVDLKGVSKDVVNNVDGLVEFLKSFPSKIGMHVLKGPEVVSGIDENPGITGFVIIDYSHISIHTFSKHDEALVDIFSCKLYDQEVAVQVALDYFKVPRENARIQQVCWE